MVNVDEANAKLDEDQEGTLCRRVCFRDNCCCQQSGEEQTGNLAKNKTNFHSIIRIELIVTLSSSAVNFLSAPLTSLICGGSYRHRNTPKDYFFSIFFQVQLQLAGLCFGCD